MPEPATVYLTEVRRLDDGRRVRFTWTDHHSATFEADYLRGYCPCAMCQGHESSETRFQPPSRPVTIVAIEPVGNYAINVTFSDRHATGIYRFDFLRRVCPCEECTGA